MPVPPLGRKDYKWTSLLDYSYFFAAFPDLPLDSALKISSGSPHTDVLYIEWCSIYRGNSIQWPSVCQPFLKLFFYTFFNLLWPFLQVSSNFLMPLTKFLLKVNKSMNILENFLDKLEMFWSMNSRGIGLWPKGGEEPDGQKRLFRIYQRGQR